RGELVRREELRRVRGAFGRRLVARLLGVLVRLLCLGLRPCEPGRRGRAEHLQRLSSIECRHAESSARYTASALRCSAMYSLVRHARAMMVHVRFLSACETNGAASATNRFFTSCAWQCALSADVFGSLPMRTTPASWMIRPPASRP